MNKVRPILPLSNYAPLAPPAIDYINNASICPLARAQVTLDCKDKDDNPTTMQKKVQIITNCSCSSCMESSRIKPDFNSLLQSLELESTRLSNQNNNNNHQHHHHHHHHLNQQQEQVPPTLQALLQDSDGPSPAPEPSSVVKTGAAGESAAGLAPVSPSPAAAAAAAEPTEAPETSATPAAAVTGAGAAAVPDLVSGGVLHETPDLLLDPNLQGSAAGGKAAAGAKSSERLMQLFKQLKDPNLGGTDKLENLSKLKGLEKLEKLEKLGESRSVLLSIFYFLPRAILL